MIVFHGFTYVNQKNSGDGSSHITRSTRTRIRKLVLPLRDSAYYSPVLVHIDSDIAMSYDGEYMSSQYPKLILPKGYLSHSQMVCWMSNRARYVKEYFEDGERLKTRYLDFGSKFSKLIEDLGEIMNRIPNRFLAIQELKKGYPMDENMESVLMELDIEGESEYQIGNSGKPDDKTPVCKIQGIVPILAFLDKYRSRDGSIGEYKTGLQPWTLARVQKHDQLPFYGAGLKASGKPMPEYADLHWVETKEVATEHVDFWRDGNKVIMATGKIKTFHRELDPREFERVEDLIIRVAWEISDAYQDHLAQI